tara:strand:- start:970 stop:1161 length:192 start_codon:yes stop_codon:yes gene_type:complete
MNNLMRGLDYSTLRALFSVALTGLPAASIGQSADVSKVTSYNDQHLAGIAADDTSNASRSSDY